MSTHIMRAIQIHSYGGPEQLKLEETPRPAPEAGEVLVRVHAAGVNPIDWQILAYAQSGQRRGRFVLRVVEEDHLIS